MHETAIDLLEASRSAVFRLTIGYDEVESEGVASYTSVRSVEMLPDEEQERFEQHVAKAVESSVDDSWSWDIYGPVPAKGGADCPVFIDGDRFEGTIAEVLYTPTDARPEYAPKGDWIVKVDVCIPGRMDG